MAKAKKASRTRYNPHHSPFIQAGVVLILVAAILIFASLGKRFPNLFY